MRSQLTVLFTGITCALAGTSCSNYGPAHGFTALSLQQGTSIGQINVPSPGGGASIPYGFSCPSLANVRPNNSDQLGVSEQFTACPSSLSASSLYVTGISSQGSGICVFAAQMVNSETVYYVPDPTTGSPMVSCSSQASGGWTFQFASGTSFNAVFIVELPDESAMNLCMTNGSAPTCPAYSYGTFR